MRTLEDIRIKKVFWGSEGRFIRATYEDWCFEYSLYIDKDGRIRGKTSVDTWVELSEEARRIVQHKLREYLQEEHHRETNHRYNAGGRVRGLSSFLA